MPKATVLGRNRNTADYAGWILCCALFVAHNIINLIKLTANRRKALEKRFADSELQVSRVSRTPGSRPAILAVGESYLSGF